MDHDDETVQPKRERVESRARCAMNRPKNENGAGKWVSIALAATALIVGAAIYVADTRATANAALDRVEKVESRFIERLDDIDAQLKEIIDHLRPYREYDR